VEQRVKIISISWGLSKVSPCIESALRLAISKNIIVFASASNEGARHPITFPATMDKVFCIGSADGYGLTSKFSPPETGSEKYSAVGEGVIAAYTSFVPGRSLQPQRRERSDGTSTATPVAVGVSALFLDYLRQFTSKKYETFETVRKLFIKMSAGTVGHDYRFLAPWYIFLATDPQRHITEIITTKAGMEIDMDSKMLIPCRD
jgi:hypothetical protein